MAQRFYGYLGRYKSNDVCLSGKSRPDWIGEMELGGEVYRSQVWIRPGGDGKKEAVLKLTSCRRERRIRDKYLTLRKASNGYGAIGFLGRGRYRVKLAPFPLQIPDVDNKSERLMMVLVIRRLCDEKAAVIRYDQNLEG